MDDEGVMHYGSVDTHDDQSEELFSQGLLIVNTAVLNQLGSIPIERVEAALSPNHVSGGRWDAYEVDVYVEAEYQKAKALAESLPEGLHVNKIFSTGVADGHAHYIVTKVNQKTCEVEHRGFCPDNYYDQVLRGGGRFPRSTIEPLIHQQEAMAKLFAKKG